MKYYIISGEASGDMHAANLVASLKKQDEKAEIRAWGGDKLKEQDSIWKFICKDLEWEYIPSI